MKFRLNETVKIGNTVIHEGDVIEVIEAKDRVASRRNRHNASTRRKAGFMRPVCFKDNVYEVDTAQGIFILPESAVGKGLRRKEIENLLGGAKVYEVEKHKNVFVGRFSASGYMDATDYVMADSAQKLYDILSDYIPDDDSPETMEDLEELADACGVKVSSTRRKAAKGFSLKFKTDNAAFDDSPEYEVSRILKDIAEKVELGSTKGSVLDINGNDIGQWSM